MTERTNDEDRAWLESDLSRLGGHEPYELSGEQRTMHVPGVGLVVDDGAPFGKDRVSGAPRGAL